MAKQVLAKQHIRQYNPTQRKMAFKTLKRRGYDLLHNETIIRRPSTKFSNANIVHLRAQYHGHVLVVQEILGPHPLVRSYFAKNLMNLLVFTPEQAMAQRSHEPPTPLKTGEKNAP